MRKLTWLLNKPVLLRHFVVRFASTFQSYSYSTYHPSPYRHSIEIDKFLFCFVIRSAAFDVVSGWYDLTPR